jgi:DNA-binding transcriptional ArsR family regulator
VKPLGPVVEAQLEHSARVLSLFANGKRLEILSLLARGDQRVGDIVVGTGSSFSAISQALKLLNMGGLIERRKDGRNVYYHLKDPGTLKVLEVLSNFCHQEARRNPATAEVSTHSGKGRSTI